MIQSFRYTLRSLLKARTFSLIAIVTLALGIGANSTLYSLMNELLFSNAPFPDRERIVTLVPRQLGTATEDLFGGLSYAEIEELKTRNDLFAESTVYHVTRKAITRGDQAPEQIMVTSVAPNFFSFLRTPPLLGRTFTPEECQGTGANVVMLSHDYWLKEFAGRREAVGETLRMNGQTFSIIGVLPDNYSYRQVFFETKLFAPLSFYPEQINERTRREFYVLGRLLPDVGIEPTVARLATVAEKWASDFPHQYEKYRLELAVLGRRVSDSTKGVFFLLSALGVAILLISCANLANLQLARAAGRVRELAIRSALGASRSSLIKLQLGEALLLSGAGGLLGLLLAAWLNEFIGNHMLVSTEATLYISIDSRVLLFTAFVSIVTAFGFGLFPAWIASKVDIGEILKSQTRGTTGNRKTRWFKNSLVVGQVSMAFVLLSVAVGMVASVRTELNRPFSWQPERVLFATVELDENQYPTEASRRNFHETLLRRVRQIPGIEGATVANNLPNMIYGGGQSVTVVHEQLDPTRSDLPLAGRFMVMGDYFSTLGIPLIKGRDFPAEVKAGDPVQVIINETLARQFWPDEDPLGKRLGVKNADGSLGWAEVIGVVGQVEDPANVFSKTVPAQFYVPFVHNPWAWFQVAVRDREPARLKNDLRIAVSELDPTVAPRMVYTLPEIRRLFLQNVYVVNSILFGVAGLGLALAGVGLFAIISNHVEQRMPEFGVRLALGAQPQNLLWMVVRQGMRLALIGLGSGYVLSLLIGQGMAAQNEGMAQPSRLYDLATLATVAVIAFLSTWWPARRATEADPMAALRAD